MRLTKTIILAYLTTAVTTTAISDNHANANSSMLGVQSIGCTFKSGKDINDLKNVLDDLSKWSDKNSSIDYSAMVVQPVFSNAAAKLSDALMMFFYRNVEDLGTGMDEWLSGNDGATKIQSKYESICTQEWQSMWLGQPVRAPKEASKTGAIRIRLCTLDSASSPAKMRAADAAWNKELESVGIDSGRFRMWPGPGVSPNIAPNQFLSLTGFESVAAYGRTVDTSVANNMRTKFRVIYGDLFSCNNGGLGQFEQLRVRAAQ